MQSDRYDLLIVGAGHAGLRAAQAARKAACGISIGMIGAEPHLPYQRPPLSKGGLVDPQQRARSQLAPDSFFAEQRITILLGTPVARIDAAARTVEMDSGRRVGYGQLVLATGSRARALAGLEGSGHVLRTLDDAVAVGERLRPGKRLAVIGGGFIGLELAATATKAGCDVTVYEGAPQVLARLLPGHVAEPVARFHRERGVEILTDCRIAAVCPDARGGYRIESGAGVRRHDHVVAGIGVLPNTGLAEDAGLVVDDGILVDEYGRTSNPDIFAAGEVTRHPTPGCPVPQRIESWQVAEQQAACAGSSVAGVPTAYRQVPWLWSDQGDLNLQILGVVPRMAEWIIRGALDAPSFCAIAMADSAPRAVLGFNAGRDIAALRRVLGDELPVSATDLADTGMAWRAIMDRAGKVRQRAAES